MELHSETTAIKKIISQGNLEEAIEHLVAFLEPRPEMAQLTQIARVIQADFFQNKAQILRGAISSDDARTTNNQLSSNILYIINRVEQGKNTLNDPAPTASAAPSKSKLIYILVGFVIAGLAVISWFFLKKDDGCPEYGAGKKIRVLILPFRQDGEKKSTSAEVSVMDGLNDLIDRDIALTQIAEADINEQYPIDQNYPNPSEALNIAKDCGTEMIVWGVRTGRGDTVEVRYKIVNAARKINITQDTALAKMLALSDEGVWTKDAKTISKLLYLVVRSLSGTSLPMAADIRKSLAPSPPLIMANETRRWASMDTTYYLSYADQFMGSNTDSVLHYLDEILSVYPRQPSALKKRSAIYMSTGREEDAAKDLEILAPDPKKANIEVQKLRVRAYLDSDQPDKAKQDIEYIKTKMVDKADEKWVEERQQEAVKSTIKLQQQSIELDKKAKMEPKNTRSELAASKANLGLGQTDLAAKRAEKILKTDPKNKEAIQFAVNAFEAKGDTAKVRRIVIAAQKEGISVRSKNVFTPPILVQPLKQ